MLKKISCNRFLKNPEVESVISVVKNFLIYTSKKLEDAEEGEDNFLRSVVSFLEGGL